MSLETKESGPIIPAFWRMRTMPIAQDRLEQLQVLKLLQSVRLEDVDQIEKLTTHGVPYLINYSGKCREISLSVVLSGCFGNSTRTCQSP